MNTPIIYEYTGARQSTFLHAGFYKFQLWGASGADSDDALPGTGGKGGFVEGILKFGKGLKLFVYVGGAGAKSKKTCFQPYIYEFVKGGFNGGGDAWSAGSCGTGGGASDIRVNIDSIDNRILVAGGGGGSTFLSVGGDGGNEVGGKAKLNTGYESHVSSIGLGGTNVSGGGIDKCSLKYCIETDPKFVGSGFSNSFGSIGKGGNAIGRRCGGGSGGGGFYGGGGSVNTGGGGGGSSYAHKSAVEVIMKQGVSIGNGRIIITNLFLIKESQICNCAYRSHTLFITIILLNSLSIL